MWLAWTEPRFDPHYAQRTCRAIGRFDDSNVTYPCFIRARDTECGCRARLSLVCRLRDAKRRSAVTRRAPAPRPPWITLPALDTTCRLYIPVSDVSSQFTISCHVTQGERQWLIRLTMRQRQCYLVYKGSGSPVLKGFFSSIKRYHKYQQA